MSQSRIFLSPMHRCLSNVTAKYGARYILLDTAQQKNSPRGPRSEGLRNLPGERLSTSAVGARGLRIDQRHKHGQALRAEARDLALEQTKLPDEAQAEGSDAGAAAALAAGDRNRHRFGKALF